MYLLLSCMYRDNCEIEIVTLQQISEFWVWRSPTIPFFSPVQPARSIGSPYRRDVQQTDLRARLCLFAHSYLATSSSGSYFRACLVWWWLEWDWRRPNLLQIKLQVIWNFFILFKKLCTCLLQSGLEGETSLEIYLFLIFKTEMLHARRTSIRTLLRGPAC